MSVCDVADEFDLIEEDGHTHGLKTEGCDGTNPNGNYSSHYTCGEDAALVIPGDFAGRRWASFSLAVSPLSERQYYLIETNSVRVHFLSTGDDGNVMIAKVRISTCECVDKDKVR